MALKPVLAAHAALATGRQGAAVALREVLRELYPAALRAYPDPAEPIPLAILDALPEPGLLATGVTRGRDAAVAAELANAGVADLETITEAITALRVAIAETPRRAGIGKTLTTAVAETIRQSVAAVRACDLGVTALVGLLAEKATPVPAANRPAATRTRTPAQPLRAIGEAAPRRSRTQPAASALPTRPLADPAGAPYQPATPDYGYSSFPAAALPGTGSELPRLSPDIPAPGSRDDWPLNTAGVGGPGLPERQLSADPAGYPATSLPPTVLERPGRLNAHERQDPQPPILRERTGAQPSLHERTGGQPVMRERTGAQPILPDRTGQQPMILDHHGMPLTSQGSSGLPPAAHAHNGHSMDATPVPHQRDGRITPPWQANDLPPEPPALRLVEPEMPRRADRLTELPRAERPRADRLTEMPRAERLTEMPRRGDRDPMRDAISADEFARDPGAPPLRLVEPNPLVTPPPRPGQHVTPPNLGQHVTPPPHPGPALNGHSGGHDALDRPMDPSETAGDGELLIFAQASAWFTGQVDDQEESVNWSNPADLGWQAAERATQPILGDETTAGLPRRVPQANLVPGSPLPPASERQLRIVRDPAAMAQHTTGYFRGSRRGEEVRGFSLGGRPGREADGGWDFSRDGWEGDQPAEQGYEYRSAARR